MKSDEFDRSFFNKSLTISLTTILIISSIIIPIVHSQPVPSISVTKTMQMKIVNDECQVKGTITILNTFSESKTIDWIDQIQSGPTAVPGFAIDAPWSANDVVIPQGTTEIHIPPSGDWFVLSTCPPDGIDFYNIVWIGYGDGVDTSTPTSADWTFPTGSYEFVSFAATTLELVFPPVGGVASPVNKLEILTPYIALVGLIIAVSTVYVIKKRKD